MKKVVVIKKNANDFERFYSDALERSNVRCFDPYVNLGKIADFLCHVFMHFSLPGYKFFYSVWTKNIGDADVVIVFDWLYSHKIIQDIKKINPKCRVIFWIWNKIEPRISEKMLDNYKSVYWTFDPGDAKEYGIKLNTQFYAATKNDIEEYSILNNNIMSDVFFCGKDKGRIDNLIKIKSDLESSNLKFDCYVVRDETSKDINKFDYQLQGLSYYDVLDKIKCSRCILDLTRQDQEGLTIRSLEALYYSKLLITDNKFIKKAKFYNKDYIYILGEDKRSLSAFVRQDLPKYSRENKEYYCVEEWLKRFGA